jgi:hypothetical protein
MHSDFIIRNEHNNYKFIIQINNKGNLNLKKKLFILKFQSMIEIRYY